MSVESIIDTQSNILLWYPIKKYLISPVNCPFEMAATSSKKIIVRNDQIMQNVIKGEILSFLSFMAVLFFRKKYFSRWCIFLFLTEICVIYCFKRISKITQIDGKKIPAGNLDSAGLNKLLFDILYMAWAGKIAILFYKWILFVQFLVLALSIYYNFMMIPFQ